MTMLSRMDNIAIAGHAHGDESDSVIGVPPSDKLGSGVEVKIITAGGVRHARDLFNGHDVYKNPGARSVQFRSSRLV